jgi:hypothetical protein
VAASDLPTGHTVTVHAVSGAGSLLQTEKGIDASSARDMEANGGSDGLARKRIGLEK